MKRNVGPSTFISQRHCARSRAHVFTFSTKIWRKNLGSHQCAPYESSPNSSPAGGRLAPMPTFFGPFSDVPRGAPCGALPGPYGVPEGSRRQSGRGHASSLGRFRYGIDTWGILNRRASPRGCSLGSMNPSQSTIACGPNSALLQLDETLPF